MIKDTGLSSNDIIFAGNDGSAIVQNIRLQMQASSKIQVFKYFEKIRKHKLYLSFDKGISVCYSFL